MKALTVRQPWAWLIVSGHKDIENRKWFTRHRGAILIHAGKRIDSAGMDYVARLSIRLPSSFALGGIIGSVDLVDCVTQADSPWFTGPYGFVLKHARELPFEPHLGRLGFWVPDSNTSVDAAPQAS